MPHEINTEELDDIFTPGQLKMEVPSLIATGYLDPDYDFADDPDACNTVLCAILKSALDQHRNDPEGTRARVDAWRGWCSFPRR